MCSCTYTSLSGSFSYKTLALPSHTLTVLLPLTSSAAVAVLVDAEPKALEAAKFLVNAAKTGVDIICGVHKVETCIYTDVLSNEIHSLGLNSALLIHRANDLSWSPFLQGKKDVVEILLEAGMDPNSFDHDSGKGCREPSKCHVWP